MARVGYLAAATSFDGTVHSVFAHACNIVCQCGFLTIVAGKLADGPTVWQLAGNTWPDFRRFFEPGERLRRRNALASTRNLMLDLASAEPWHPAPPPDTSSEGLAAKLAVATEALEHYRRARSSVLDREAETSLASLEDSCRRLDVVRAIREIDRLVGWGEGLTPAGDDALVGLLAAIGAVADRDADRMMFLRGIAAAIGARAARTTAVSGHYLRLAAQGHFNADVTRLVHAFIGGESYDDVGVHAALAAALGVGATSGADMVTGMVAGFRAWSPSNE